MSLKDEYENLTFIFLFVRDIVSVLSTDIDMYFVYEYYFTSHWTIDKRNGVLMSDYFSVTYERYWD